MFVVKRDGRRESVKFDKITARIENLCRGLNKNFIQPIEIAKKVINGLYDGVTTVELDNLASETAASMTTKHPDFGILAARIAISNLHKVTERSFSTTMKRLYEHEDSRSKYSLISKKTYSIIRAHAKQLDEAINHDRDYDFDFFGYKTLERSYLIKLNGKPMERPQHLLMRVAVGIHGEDINAVIQTYELMSRKWFIHATPTLFNAGTSKPQLSSCFLLALQDDSIEGIYETLKQSAKISQSAGGIGLHIHNIRSTGAYIKGTNGTSNGIVPMLRNFDMTARYVDQGGGKRKGSFAIYLEPWHGDIFEFLELKRNHGKEEMRARDLFYALWIPDLFMRRVENNEKWSLFSPDTCPGLHESHGKDFEQLYTKYEKEERAIKTINAQDLWFKIIESQIETGTPYMLYKDAANKKSNQKNLGTIKSSNLCTEIIQYTSKDEVAVCNLASISLPKFVIDNGFDHQKLYEITKILVNNLNKVIDINYYPVQEAKNSNLKHRPIGLGVQGLADVFALLKLPFDSQEARKLNKEIFETMYYGSMEASMELAIKDGSYETYKGSPVSRGIYQFDMWGVEPSSGRWDWIALKQKTKKFGIRNSLLLAPMPTASTSQILGNNECFEPFTSNLYLRRVLSGEFIVANKYLMKELIALGLWNEKMKNRIQVENGSIQNIDSIPEDVKLRYRTVWEIPQKSIIDMSCDRGAYICQSQSLNIHMKNPNFAKITSMHFYAWKKGLKTGMYYLRTKAPTDAIKFTLTKEHNQATTPNATSTIESGSQNAVPYQQQQVSKEISCSLDEPEGCEMCGS